MSDKPRIKYEKPVSIDMGRVAPILGARCSTGNSADDCSIGLDNALQRYCQAGGGASNNCQTGSGAHAYCVPTGSSAAGGCFSGMSG
jgi:hypothetical protein